MGQYLTDSQKLPVLSIIKNRDADASWSTWTTAIDGSYDQMYLDVIDGKGNLSQSAPTSTVFTNTGSSGNGASGQTYISYHWHNVPGLQKFGKCNGSIATAQPDFVELGFKPALVIIKRADSTGNWTFWDSVRNEHNPATKQLFTTSPSNQSDLSADAIDILSNGFAIRSSSSFTQTGSQSYLYMAGQKHHQSTCLVVALMPSNINRGALCIYMTPHKYDHILIHRNPFNHKLHNPSHSSILNLYKLESISNVRANFSEEKNQSIKWHT